MQNYYFFMSMFVFLLNNSLILQNLNFGHNYRKTMISLK